MSKNPQHPTSKVQPPEWRTRRRGPVFKVWRGRRRPLGGDVPFSQLKREVDRAYREWLERRRGGVLAQDPVFGRTGPGRTRMSLEQAARYYAAMCEAGKRGPSGLLKRLAAENGLVYGTLAKRASEIRDERGNGAGERRAA